MAKRKGPLLVNDSPLRKADPRTKLALCLGLSLTVMLPLEKLFVATVAYALLLLWARLFRSAVEQIWRIRFLLLGLFIVDWLVVSPYLAMVVTLRLIFLTNAFTLFFATTTPGELRLALEWLRLPYPYAFSLSLAFQSLDLLDSEWRAILEAQQSRGAWHKPGGGLRELIKQIGNLVAISVPAVVLTAKRAWGMTEAAYARGFDSPHRTSYHELTMGRLDWILLAGSLAGSVALLLWR
ncbi:MAG: energy-coupling factor transporter transmembrane protein EcfT [Anaerolineae bacterium]|nr:energy-coupling factor transporter transmembrane protein EcfT [Anaerolineae bacterium]